MYSIMQFLEGKVEKLNKKIFKLVDDKGNKKFYSVKHVSFDCTM